MVVCGAGALARVLLCHHEPRSCEGSAFLLSLSSRADFSPRGICSFTIASGAHSPGQVSFGADYVGSRLRLPAVGRRCTPRADACHHERTSARDLQFYISQWSPLAPEWAVREANVRLDVGAR